MILKKKNEKSIFDISVFKISFIIWTIIQLTGFKNLYFEQVDCINASVSKLLLLPFIYIMVLEIKRLIINRKDKTVKMNIIISIIFFFILMLSLLLIWPGAWSWDDISIVYGTNIYEFTPWQHFFSGLFQILCLEILPFNAGILIIQILISSLIVGYSISELTYLIKFKSEKKKIIFAILLFIPCILPPMIEYILSGFRMGIYSYLELLLIVKCIKFYIQSDKIETSELISVIFLGIIVACWRSEAIYYILALPLFLIFLGKKKIGIKKIILSSIILIGSTISIGKINNSMIGQNNYSLLATINPLVEIIKEEKRINSTYEFEGISKVMNIDIIDPKSDISGEGYYGMDLVKENYSDEDYSGYMKSYIKLLLKYPKTAFKSMWDMFVNSSGLGVKNKKSLMRSAMTVSSATVFDLYNEKNLSGYMWSNSRSKLKNPINLEVRNKFLRYIGCLDKNLNVTGLYYLNWNLFIPVILLLITSIMSLIKKKYLMFYIGLFLIGRLVLVFMTACAPYFMYYLSIYLIGYIYSIFNMVYFNKKG